MGTVSRVHTFASGAILTAAQLNNEFDNLLTSSAINGGLDATNLGVTAGQATASKALVIDASRNLADATGSNRINNLALSGTFESTGAVTASAGITSGGNIVSDTDSTDDLGTTGVRWANLFVDDVTVTNNVTIGGTLTLTGGITLNGNTTIGDSSADTLTVNSTITSNLIFTDATYDIGASGATRPRDLHLSRNALMGGTLGVTGLITATGGVSGALTGNVTGNVTGNLTGDVTGNISGNVTGGTISGSTATFSGLISGNGGAEIGSNTAKVKFYSDANYSGIYNGSSLGSDESYYFGSGDHFWYSDGSLAMKIDNGDFAVDTDTLFVDASADRVGINTTSPHGPLTVKPAANENFSVVGGSGDLRLSALNDAQSATVQLSIQADPLYIRGTGGVIKTTFLGNGNVGIGTDSPTGLLNLIAEGATPYTGASDVLLELKRGVTNTGSGNATAIRLGNNSNVFKISYGGSADHLQFIDGGNLTVMTLTNSNNRVGIGTESPESKLHVETTSGGGVIQIGRDTGAAQYQYINFGGNVAGDDAWQVGRSSNSGGLGGNGAFYIYDLKNSATRLSVDTSGNLLVGATSAFGIITAQAAAGNNVATLQSAGATAGTRFIRFDINGSTEVGSITYTGSATAYNTSSDYRIKENITEITDGITRIKSLKPSRFNFISNADQTVDGFVAHEVSDIVPEAITGEKDAVDDEGNPEYQGIDQSKLVPLLTAALQEAITKIETLETKVAALEAA